MIQLCKDIEGNKQKIIEMKAKIDIYTEMLNLEEVLKII